MKLLDLLLEAKYDYGCVMLFFKLKEMNKIHKSIEKEDLYEVKGDDTYGLSTEPHITLLFGLHKGVTTEDVISVLDNIKFGECEIYKPSLFENDLFDVLKFNVRYTEDGNRFLHQANKELKEFPFTSNYPDYKPHMTIAYLKKGKGKKYKGSFKELSYVIEPDYAVYSKPDKTKTKIKLK